MHFFEYFDRFRDCFILEVDSPDLILHIVKTLISVRLNKLDLITLVLLEFWFSYPFDFSLFNKNVKDETDLPADEVTKIITL